MLSVTPEATNAHAFVVAAMRTSCSFVPSTARQTSRPRNSRHTSQRIPPWPRLEYTINPPRTRRTASASQDVDFLAPPDAGGARGREQAPRRFQGGGGGGGLVAW